MDIFYKIILSMSADMSSTPAILLSERGFLVISLAASGPSMSFTMALQIGSINVSATVYGFFDLAMSSELGC